MPVPLCHLYIIIIIIIVVVVVVVVHCTLKMGLTDGHRMYQVP
jgi:hypothetical protein